MCVLRVHGSCVVTSSSSSQNSTSLKSLKLCCWQDDFEMIRSTATIGRSWTIFFLTIIIHGSFCIAHLENIFLRYDDIKNFRNIYVDVPSPTTSTILSTTSTIWTTTESLVLAVWEPVAQTVKLLVVQAFGNSRLVHTAISIILFAAAAKMMVELLDLVFYLLQQDDPTNAPDTLHFISVLFFVLSASRVEIIAWVSCQSYILALFFSILFVHSWLKWRFHKTSTTSWWLPLAPTLYYSLAVMSKAAAMPLFLAVVIIELAVLHTTGTKPFKQLRWTHNISFLSMCLVAILAAWMAVSANDSLHEKDILQSHIDYERILLNVLSCTKHYFYNIINPRACVHFFHENDNVNTSTVSFAECIVWRASTVSFAECICLCIVISVMCITKSIASCALCSVAYFIMLSPGIVAGSFGLHGAQQGGAAHDRYALLADALVGVPAVTLVLKWFCRDVLGRWKTNRSAATPAAPPAAPTSTKAITNGNVFWWTSFLVVILLSYCSPRLHITYSHWKNTKALWENVIQKNPNDVHALLSLGDVYSVGCHRSTCLKSISYMERALKLDNTKSDGWYNLATTLYKADRKLEALDTMQRVIQLSPMDTIAMDKILRLAVETRTVNIFMQFYQQALSLYSNNQGSNRPGTMEHIEFITKTATTLPKHYSIEVLDYLCTHFPSSNHWSIFGTTLHQQGEIRRAIISYKEALLLDPAMNDIVHNLGIAHWQNGNVEEAHNILTKGMKEHPEDIEMKKTWKMIVDKNKKSKS